MQIISWGQAIRHSRCAFTLIELLIVMGIIATLMAILLPALASSREEARSVICTTHLEQIFKASYMYSTANDDRLPHYGWMGGRPEGQEWWPTQIAEMLNGETQMYVCPSDTEPNQDTQVVTLPGGTLVMSKGIEPGRFTLDLSYRGSCDSVVSMKSDYIARRITDWEQPSKALVLIEGTVTDDITTTRPNRECFRFSDGLTQVGTLDWYTIDPYAYTWQRHSGSSNMLFLDGGIGRHKPKEIREIAMRQEYWDSNPFRRGRRSF